MSKVCPKDCPDYGKCYECPVVHHAGDLKIDNIDTLIDELIKEKEVENGQSNCSSDRSDA